MPHQYIKIVGGRLFKNDPNDKDGNPRKGPPLSSSNCEVLEDIRKGDKLDIAAWINRDESGEQTMSITVTKKVLSQPAPSQGDRNDPPWG